MLFVVMNMASSSTLYIETNQSVLDRIFNELRWSILEMIVIEKNNLNPIQVMMQSVYGSDDNNKHHNEMVRLLQETVTFEGPGRKLNKQNYHVIKHRLTKYREDIVENEIRAGYMYILVRKADGVAVSYEYVGDGADISTSNGVKEWMKWDNQGESWIIYDGVDGHIRGNLSGSLMD